MLEQPIRIRQVIASSPIVGSSSSPPTMLTTSDTKRRIALLALCLLLAIACIWLNWSLFASFWRSPVTSSFDGMSHFSVGEYYAKHTFPKTWGWTPLWFGGMPFPDFYPPLYYLVTALLYHLLPFSYTTVTKTFLCFLLTVLPGLSAWVGLAQTRNWWAALAAGCLTLLAISSPEYALGIAVYSTVTQGLFTQLLGYICLLLWYRYFFAADESLISRLLAGLFMFLLLLCNVHIVPVAVLFIVVWATLATIRSMRARDVRAGTVAETGIRNPRSTNFRAPGRCGVLVCTDAGALAILRHHRSAFHTSLRFTRPLAR